MSAVNVCSFEKRRAVKKPSIDTKPNWGDFKAFSTLDRVEGTLLRPDIGTSTLTMQLNEETRVLKIGGPPERLAGQLKRMTKAPLQLVRWNSIWVVGIPVRSGHALFRGEEAGGDS